MHKEILDKLQLIKAFTGYTDMNDLLTFFVLLFDWATDVMTLQEFKILKKETEDIIKR